MAILSVFFLTHLISRVLVGGDILFIDQIPGVIRDHFPPNGGASASLIKTYNSVNTDSSTNNNNNNNNN
eukprot:CAMPEP_0202452346 /NCGR_PEP_ID=MMETSP1360-20130828/10578_1 /ASSEMBLY_ACC=CAM_ASM_000848 /TAXON_ID=515479 /ORGANISM="Licmophora paradoxa, Strain CCMP2313" /LENGTH=68 /DNA_ID=CAMNT_0049071139 /DNA_START=80 /DNA_END=283 /DNA_ORIENTATION=+